MKISEFRPFLITMALCVPGGLIRFAHPELSPFIIVILTGFAIFGASFMLTWTCEAAEMDIPQAVAVAVVALIAVLPEYSVDMYFTWMAGQNPDSRYTHYAIANMTGANRLLIGLGWSVLVFIFAVRFHRGIDLLNDKRTDLAFLGLATLYALFVSWKGSLTLLDGCIFFAMYVGYMAIVSRRPVEAGEQEGPPRWHVFPVRFESVLWRSFSCIPPWSLRPALSPSARALLPQANSLASMSFFSCSGWLQWRRKLRSSSWALCSLCAATQPWRWAASFHPSLTSGRCLSA